jgi:hypothetical protein
VLRVDEIAAEALVEFLGVLALGEAENGYVHIVAAIGVAARAQRQSLPLAEEVDSQAVVAEAPVGRKRDLVRPVSVHHCLAEFAFTIDQGRLRDGRRPQLDATCRERGKDMRSRSAGGVSVNSIKRTKREQQFGWL